jgi:glutamine synthetase
VRGDELPNKPLARARDEDYVDYFIKVKRDEWTRYHEQVTPWELKEYLTRF